MDNSQAQLIHSDLYQNIKTEVQAKNEKNQQPIEQTKIGLDRLAPFLENLQTISNHNLAVATQAQNQNANLNQQLQLEFNKSHHFKKELHKANKNIRKLQETLSLTQIKLNNDLSQSNTLSLQKQSELSLKNEILNQLEERLLESTNKIRKLEEVHTQSKKQSISKEEQLQEQINKSYDKVDFLNNEHNNMLKINNTQSLQIAILHGELNQIKSREVQEKKDFDQKNNEFRGALQNRENKLESEIRLHANIKAELSVKTQQFNEIEDLYKTIKLENKILSQDNRELFGRNDKLQRDADMNFKEKIKDINESFIIRLTNLEAQIQLKHKEYEEQTLKISQLTHQLKVSESSRDILQQECENFEISFDIVKKEKEMYLNEFRNLKDKYQATIDTLENEIQRLKLNNRIFAEDNKTLKVQTQIFFYDSM